MKWILMPLAVLLAVGCSSGSAPVVPSMAPVGDGLKVIGFGIVAAAVVVGASKFIRE